MEMSKREQLMHIMQTHHIDILALQETKVSSSSEEQKIQQDTAGNRFLFLFSSKPQVVQQPPQQQNQPARQAKAKARNVEHHGVGFVVGPRLLECRKDCNPHSSRLIELSLHNHGPDIHIVNHYAPHSGRPLEEKTQHWDTLQEVVRARSRSLPTFILGDTNARVHGSTEAVEDQVIGRHVFGHGALHVRNLPEAQRENRQCLIDFCITNEYVLSNTFFLKPDRKKCT